MITAQGMRTATAHLTKDKHCSYSRVRGRACNAKSCRRPAESQYRVRRIVIMTYVCVCVCVCVPKALKKINPSLRGLALVLSALALSQD